MKGGEETAPSMTGYFSEAERELPMLAKLEK